MLSSEISWYLCLLGLTLRRGHTNAALGGFVFSSVPEYKKEEDESNDLNN